MTHRPTRDTPIRYCHHDSRLAMPTRRRPRNVMTRVRGGDVGW